MQNRFLSVVIPVYGNSSTLNPLYLQIKNVLETHQIFYEVLFVNDASPDDSKEVLAQLTQRDPRIRMISLSQNLGQNRAVLKGLEESLGERVVVLDADLQDPPEVIPSLLFALDEGADAVFAGRRGKYESWVRLLGSRGFKWLLHKIAKTPIDAGLFVALDRSVVSSLLKMSRISSYLVGMIGFAAKNIRSIPVVRNRRAEGFSTYSCAQRIKLGSKALYEMLSLKWFFFRKVFMKAEDQVKRRK
ncbi:MAG TPA: glycosyltransferase family 2 protein [Rhabdochlamydiaceae bacterium]|nr:glycosyltransferase family 2 protein [Rhabdochlamydiaceae bacterium]HSX38157.1 glycosyltransferase family 2 protein [Chlamydiales bacterium]